MNSTVGDIFLIAAIFNTLALFITDVMTYKLGGMYEDGPEPSDDTLIQLKKVMKVLFLHQIGNKTMLTSQIVGTVRGELFL